jgi:hypothetical protein
VQVSVRLEPAANFAPAADLVAVVGRHQAVLRELDQAPLFRVEAGAALSSRNNRIGETSLCTRLVTCLRDALGAECCLLNAGALPKMAGLLPCCLLPAACCLLPAACCL